MDILKLKGENMKKIHPIFERLICILVILLLSPITIILYAKFMHEIRGFMAIVCSAVVYGAFVKLVPLSSYIIIRDNNLTVYDIPFFATDKFFEEKRSLISYNTDIYIDEVEKIELIKLTRKEQKLYIGYSRLINKYLKFHLKYGKFKYIYVGNYSKRQIKKIINIVKK